MAAGSRQHTDRHFLSWISRGLTGCSFATDIAQKHKRAATRIQCVTILNETSPDLPAALETQIDSCATAKEVAAVVFPRLRTTEDIARLLWQLSTSPLPSGPSRWQCKRVDLGRADDVAIGLWWTTATGPLSSVMGFAPLGSMPVTRRAPYVAILLWPGGYENVHRTTRNSTVGIVQAPVTSDAEEYQRIWDRTTEVTAELLSEPQENPALLRKVAFCLPRNGLGAHAAFVESLA